MKNRWIVGGNEIQGFTISRLARPNENVSARNWVLEARTYNTGHERVRVFRNKETAKRLTKGLNKHL